MTSWLRCSAVALALATGWVLPARAQSAESALVQREIAAMRAEMARMAQRIDTLETQLAAAQAKADAATAAAIKPSVAAKPATELTWDGGLKFTGKDGWSFKPRGRAQFDAARVGGPSGLAAKRSLGFTSEFRRVYMGFEGTVPGGFGYRVEADFANNGVELTDVYLTYKASPEVTLTVGHHKPFQSMEDMTSDLFTSFLERAAFSSAFGFERRVGASATYAGKTLLVQGGVFADNARDLHDANDSYSLDGRVVFMPKLAGGQLHVGGSAHFRELNKLANAAAYSARPFVHTTDLRFVNTGSIGRVTAERGFGAELAFIRGRFRATAEASWLTARRPGLPDPTFTGGYAEVGMLLTDDVTAYKGGVYDRIRPKRPLGGGGIGALQVNVRYDRLDLNDGAVRGGRQQVAAASLLWIPTDYVRFILNYGRLWIDDAALPAAGGDRDYTMDALGLRAQFDF